MQQLQKEERRRKKCTFQIDDVTKYDKKEKKKRKKYSFFWLT